jgi:hypothetical protein
MSRARVRTMKLGEILIQLGMLQPEQLKAILQEPDDPMGAKIGTRLVERGLLDTDQVSEALGRQMRIPAALQRHFDKAEPAIVALLKPNLAARYQAIPLVAARSGPKRIVVAMATPQDVLMVDDVSFALGARIDPMVSAELAIARNLKLLYNIETKTLRPGLVESSRPATRSGTREPRNTPPATETASTEPASPPPARFEPREVLITPPPEVTVELEDALHRLSVAEHREQIADILIDFMLPRFGCGLVFLLRGTNAHVWRGFAPAVDTRAIETISFPMSMPSMFRIATERAATFRGPPPAEGTNLQTQIWKYLRCKAPADVVVIPVAIGQRIVSLVYAHAVGPNGLHNTYVQELQAMCAAAGSSFVRLIQTAKGSTEP